MTTPTIPRTSGIYKITCVPTGKFYIGSATDIANRWNCHKSELRRDIHKNTYLQHAWNKYGESSFRFEVVEYVMQFVLTDREQYWLDKLNPNNRAIGFNQNQKADRPPSQTGRTATPETRAKLSAVHKGKPKSQEMRERLSAARKGIVFSDETRAKIGIASKGRKRSNSANERIALANSKGWIVIDPDGIETSVVNLSRFCREHNLDAATMTSVATGKRGQHKGWKCRHAERCE